SRRGLVVDGPPAQLEGLGMFNLVPPRRPRARPGRPAAPAAAALAAVAVAAADRATACASCGCTLSADAAMGYSALPGWRLSVEYDYINQDTLRSGTHSVTGVPAGTELEHQTINQYVTAGLS